MVTDGETSSGDTAVFISDTYDGKATARKIDLVMTEGRPTFRRYGLQEMGTALRRALILTCGYPLALQCQPFCGRSCMFSSDQVHSTLQWIAEIKGDKEHGWRGKPRQFAPPLQLAVKSLDRNTSTPLGKSLSEPQPTCLGRPPLPAAGQHLCREHARRTPFRDAGILYAVPRVRSKASRRGTLCSPGLLGPNVL